MPRYVFGASAGYIKFGTTVLSTDMRAFDPEEEVGLVDGSAGSDAARTYLTTLKDGKATLELLAGTGGTALWAAVAPATSGTLEWGDEGTTAGKPKHTVNAIVQKRKRSTPYDDVVVYTVDFQFSGAAVTDGTY
jgi:hypothetical protein